MSTPSLSGYGSTCEKVITQRTAREFCGMFPLPGESEERAIAIHAPSKQRLYVLKYNGQYVMASPAPTNLWPEFFGINAGGEGQEPRLS